MTTPLKTRILVADDHPIVLPGLAQVLKAQRDIEVVEEATEWDEAVERATAHARDRVSRTASCTASTYGRHPIADDESVTHTSTHASRRATG